MKNVLMIFFNVVMLLYSLSCAQIFGRKDVEVPRFEIGPFLGQPIGLSARYWINSANAIDVIGAWSFTEDGLFELDASYILNYFFPEIETGEIPLYVGAGGGFRIGNDWFIGARFPIGAEYLFEQFPVSIFVELDPQWQILPVNGFVLGGGVGIRVTLGKVSM